MKPNKEPVDINSAGSTAKKHPSEELATAESVVEREVRVNTHDSIDKQTDSGSVPTAATDAGESRTAEPAQAVQAAQAATGSAEVHLGGWSWLVRFAVKSSIVLGVAALLLTMLGFAQRSEWISATGLLGQQAASAGQGEAGSGEAKRYICPMMCTPPSSEPGRCPVCAMELVEASSGGGGDGISVIIEPAARRLVGIQTAVSKRGELTRTLRTIGSIDFDESRLSTISAYIDGRLEKLTANYVGVQVHKGDDLALIYSPQLYSAQTEFVTSLESEVAPRFSVGNSDLRAMARENLGELGMTPEQIDALSQSRLPQSRIQIKSPQSGTVIEKAAVEGDYVKTGQKLLKIADLSSVWLMLDLFPDDAASVRFGQQVEAEIQSMPGEVFTGRVAFVDPTVQPTTRTVRVRVEVLNFDGKLRPGDYASARITVPAIRSELVYDPALAGKYISPMHPQVIRDDPGQCPLCGVDLVSTAQFGYAAAPLSAQRVVTVPRDALLLTGDHGVLYVETEPGRFEIRRVAVGTMNDSDAVIVAGLAAGETVATRGNFLIDSQMQLVGNPSLLDPSKAPSYSPGPLELPAAQPALLVGQAGGDFDSAFDAYFEIQRAMAADHSPPPVALSALLVALSKLETSSEVPDATQLQIAKARHSATHMDGSLESARVAYRNVSHSLLRAATTARGTRTAHSLKHFYCPMVPGGGGDWMQADGELANPYWGEEMLRCGELVRDMGEQE